MKSDIAIAGNIYLLKLTCLDLLVATLRQKPVLSSLDELTHAPHSLLTVSHNLLSPPRRAEPLIFLLSITLL